MRYFLLFFVFLYGSFSVCDNSTTIYADAKQGKGSTLFPFGLNIPLDSIATPKKTVDVNALQQSNWYAEALKGIEAMEYEIKYDAATRSYASPNRKNELRSFYTASDFILLPLNDSADKWKLELSTTGIFANDQLVYQPQPAATVTQHAKSIQFDHNHQFITEYVNTDEGVRQNFIIQKDPFVQPGFQCLPDDISNQHDSHKKNTITVKLAVNKNWVVNQVHPSEIHFAKAVKTGYDKKITYKGLKVWDAENRSLAAHFEVTNNELQIQVDAAGAVYPITIDPLSTGTAGTPDSTPDDANQSGARLGASVAGAGDINGDGYSDVIIGAVFFSDGANAFEGRAFVYHGSATGLSATPNSTPDDADQFFAQFGTSVAGAGDVNGDGYSDVIIGAPGYDDGADANEGRAFVYYGSATGLSASPNSTPDDADQGGGANFGVSVAGAGDVNGDGYSDVIIGANQYDDGGNPDEGRAFVYYGSASGLSATPNSTPDDADQESAQFGISVAGAGDVNGDGYSDVIIGAYLYDDGFNDDEGRAFVYYGSAAGLSATPNSTPDDGNFGGGQFGISVACAGDVNGDGYSDIIIGTFTFFQDRAFVYYGSASGLSATPNSTLVAVQAGSLFGFSVAGAGDVNGDGYSDVIIGAYAYDDGANSDEGRAFVYYGRATGLSATPGSTLDDADQVQACFGSSVAGAGDVNGDGYSDVIIGAFVYDDGANGDEGRAFVYHGSAAGISASPNNTPDDADQAGARFGISVAGAGDVNGDGYDDVIIGASLYDDGGNAEEGRAFVYHGSAAGLSATPNSTPDDADQVNARFGISVAGAGDVNGDGYSDVIIGALEYDDGANTNEGRVFVYYGSATGLNATPNSTPDDADQAGALFGTSVAGAGDVNGDGYSDVIIGAQGYDDGGNTDEGRAFVYYGSATGLGASPNSTPDDADQANAGFGYSVAGAGDVNGDGYSDVIIGANQYDDGGNPDEGRAFVYYGSASGLSATPNSTPDDADQAGAQFGISVACAGDVNGDGYSDVIIGAQFFADGGNTNEGRAFVYYGSVTGLNATPNSTPDDADQAGAQFGISVACAGDVNGDGYSDVIIGAHFFADGANTNEGRAFVYYGSAAGLSATPYSTPDDADQVNARLGYSVAGAGDVNGDGYSDVIIGALSYDDGANADEGRAFVYYGNESPGVNSNLRLYNTDLITPIQRSNFTALYFGAGLFAKSSQGRVKARLVWDVKPNGQAFNGNPITNSTFYYDRQTNFSDLGLTGAELKSVILKQGLQTKIRTRIEYDKVTSITGQVYGPWRYPQGYLRGAFGMNAVPLPLTLISFTAQIKNNTQQLNWIADNEDGIIHYVVERSDDRVNFVSIGTVNANAAGQRNIYSFTDNNPFARVVYYRLQIAEQDGSKTYSKIVALNNTQQYEVSIYPGPVVQGNAVTVKITGLRQSNMVIINVFSTEGKLMYSSNQFLSPGQNTMSLSTNNLSKGIYWVRIMADNKEKTYKLIVQ